MSQLQAVAPAFGVQLKVQNGDIQVVISDLGGRGEPHVIAILPVDINNGKLRIIDRNRVPVNPPDWAALNATGAFTDEIPDAVFPFVKVIPANKWPGWSQNVLVLLVYVQARGIGGTANIRPRVEDPKRSPQDRTADAIMDTLDQAGLTELRGGLIPGALPAVSPRVPPPSVTFAVASCHFPNDILDRMPADERAEPGPADASLLALGKLMGKTDSPTLLLLAGDQVYVDATAGLFDPKIRDDKFRIPYEIRAQSRGAKAAFQRLDMPVKMMIDDHEIHDNWAPNDPGEDPAVFDDTDIVRGKNGYWTYERAQPCTPFATPIWFDFVHHGLPFFLGDTRTEREARSALNMSFPVERRPQIMSPQQFKSLCDWMLKWRCLPKFILSPSALLPRRLEVARDPACALHSDAWDGYPRSQHALFQFACDNELAGLVFLSGDEHISSFTTATVTNLESQKKCTLHSIHSSALYAPYPFANGVRDDYEFDDSFCFPDPDEGPYHCAVKTDFAPGDGFALVTANRSKPAWRLLVKFCSPNGIKPNGKFFTELGLPSSQDYRPWML